MPRFRVSVQMDSGSMPGQRQSSGGADVIKSGAILRSPAAQAGECRQARQENQAACAGRAA